MIFALATLRSSWDEMKIGFEPELKFYKDNSRCGAK
jgi:hypothetical protein